MLDVATFMTYIDHLWSSLARKNVVILPQTEGIYIIHNTSPSTGHILVQLTPMWEYRVRH